MGQLAIALGVILLLALLWRAMMPGVPLIPSYKSSGPGIMSPPYMFKVVDANTVLNLP